MPDRDIDWSTDAIIKRRDTFYAASQRAFMPYETPLIFQRGEGQYLWDETGKKYIDLLGMNVCVSVGHSHPKVNAAVIDQLQQLQHCTTMFYHPVPAHFAEELVAKMPQGHDWVVHFTNSGAEAVDLALVMAQTYTGNIDMLALRNAYHGATMGAQSLTGISGFRHNVPLLGGVHHVANPDPYRGSFGDDTEAYLEEIDRTIKYATSGKLAGFIVEPVQGYGGIVEAPEGYLEAAAKMVREHGGILIADEVQSGFGRTGDTFWAFEAHNVVPEIVVLAKGIGNGFPLGAVVAKRDVAESLAGKFYFNTYGASPVSCAAGRAVLRIIDEEGLQENSRRVGGELRDVLQDLHQRYEIVGEVRGRGLMLAIELVTDRRSKAPATKEAADIFEKTRKHGLVVSKSGAFKNVLRMVPPMCLHAADVQEIGAALSECLKGY
jgi:alanine-glyoxylate transaminase/(R)-3-amino-2-methylpropionate-pyruvate transaminase